MKINAKYFKVNQCLIFSEVDFTGKIEKEYEMWREMLNCLMRKYSFYQIFHFIWQEKKKLCVINDIQFINSRDLLENTKFELIMGTPKQKLALIEQEKKNLHYL